MCFFRAPSKLTTKERVSNLIRSEYFSGIEGQSKSMKKRKKMKGNTEDFDTVWRGRYRSGKVLMSEHLRPDGYTGVLTQKWTFLPVTKHDGSADWFEHVPYAKALMQIVLCSHFWAVLWICRHKCLRCNYLNNVVYWTDGLMDMFWTKCY